MSALTQLANLAQLVNKFPYRVRIHGRGFDESARAIHRKAASENVSEATIERKTMSTKTTFKRIALVAVAATGFGLLSVVPSSATSQADSLALSSPANSVALNVAATTTLTQAFTGLGGDTMTVTASLSIAPTGNAAVPVLTTNQADNSNASTSVAGGLVGTTADTASNTVYNAAKGVYTVTFTPTIAGIYVMKFTAAVVSPNTGTVNATVQTWTVTATAAATVNATDTTSFIGAGAVAATVDATIASTMAAVTTAGSQKATIRVTSKNSVPTDLSTTTTLTASISGPGTLGFGGDSGVNNVAVGSIPSTGRAITGLVGQNLIGVFSDGTSGTAIITISAGTLVLSTETVVFYGAVATITPTVVNSVIATTNVGGSATGAITAIAKDSLGNAVAGSTLYITSSDLTVINASNLASTAVSDSTGKVTFNLPVGLKAGSATFTIGNLASASTVTAVTGAVRVGSETADSVTVIFDKNAYGVGEAATVTVALLDAAGMPVANGTYANVFTSTGLVSNYGLSGVALPGASITTTGSTGTKTFAVSMPVYAADVILSGTADTSLPLAKRVAVTSGTAVVSSPSNDAATDAANAATDAANYAADAADAATVAAEEATAAAQAAQESADAATAAVVELSTKTSALVDALRAQITGLGNYVAKVAAALGRIGTRQNQILYNQRN